METAGQALESFESARARSIRLAAPLLQAQLDFTPGPGRWSIGEVLDHLLLAEGLWRDEIGRLVALARGGQRAYIRRTFQDINVAPLFLPNALLGWLDAPFTLINRVIPDALRDFATEVPILPTRNPDRATPRPRRAGAALRGELLSSLAATRAIITANGDLDYAALVSEHPLTGPTAVPQILAFLARHERRHQTQIEGVRNDRRFPAA